MNPHCRIGKVALKGNVVLLPKSREALEVASEMRVSVERLLSGNNDRLAGFAMVLWDMDGRFGKALHYRRDSFVGENFLPDFVAAVLRRYVMHEAARDVMTGEA